MNDPMNLSRPALPRVDVIVPCYRYGHLLAECVESICRQDGVDVRVLIVDDASPDSTAQVAASLSQRDGRIEVVRHEHNLGHLATFNHGLSMVEADFVALVSADDRLTEGSLARATATMRRHPNVGFVYGRARHFRHQWREPRPMPMGTAVWSGDRWLRERCHRAVNVISSPEVVVRASCHQQVGGYEPTLPHTADLHLWLRLASVADVAYLRGRTQGGYRVHPDSLQRTVHAGARVDLTERVVMFDHLAQHAWRQRPDVAQLLGTALATLADETVERTRRLRERGRDDEAEQLAAAVAAVWPHGHEPPPYRPARHTVHTLWAGLGRRTQRQVQRWRQQWLGA